MPRLSELEFTGAPDTTADQGPTTLDEYYRWHLRLGNAMKDSRKTLYDYHDDMSEEERYEVIFNRQLNTPAARLLQPLLIGVQPWAKGLESYMYGQERLSAGKSPYVPDEHKSIARWLQYAVNPAFLISDFFQRGLHELFTHLPDVSPSSAAERSWINKQSVGALMNVVGAGQAAGRAPFETVAQEAIHGAVRSADFLGSLGRMAKIPIPHLNPDIPLATAAPIYLETRDVLRAYSPEWREGRSISKVLNGMGVPEEDIPDWLNGMDDAAFGGFFADVALDPLTWVGGPAGKAIREGAKGGYEGLRRLGNILAEHGKTTGALRMVEGVPANPALHRLYYNVAHAARRSTEGIRAKASRYLHIPFTPLDSNVKRGLDGAADSSTQGVFHEAKRWFGDPKGLHGWAQTLDLEVESALKPLLAAAKGDADQVARMFTEPSYAGWKKLGEKDAAHGLKEVVGQNMNIVFDNFKGHLGDAREAFDDYVYGRMFEGMGRVTEESAERMARGTEMLGELQLPDIPDWIARTGEDLDWDPTKIGAFGDQLWRKYMTDHLDHFDQVRTGMWRRVYDSINETDGRTMSDAVGRVHGVFTKIQDWLAEAAETGGLMATMEGNPRRLYYGAHSHRTYLMHTNVDELTRALEVVDPWMAGELKGKRIAQGRHQLRKSFIPGLAPTDPYRPRKEMASYASQAAEETAEWRRMPASAGGEAAELHLPEGQPADPLGRAAQTPRAVDTVNPAALADTLGQRGLIESTNLQVDATFGQIAQRQMMTTLNKMFGKTEAQVAKEVLGDAAVFNDKGALLLQETIDLARNVAYRKPGEDAAHWVSRLYDKFGEEGYNIAKRFDEHFWTHVTAPTSSYYGILGGKHVPRSLLEMLAEGPGHHRLGFRGFSKWWGAWKYGKVVMNPGAHARNMISNQMLIFNKLGFKVRPGNWNQARQDLADHKRPAWRLINEWTNIPHDTWTANEIRAVKHNSNGLIGKLPVGETQAEAFAKGIRGIFGAFGKAYDWEEKVGKIAVWHSQYPEYLKKFGTELASGRHSDELAEILATHGERLAGLAPAERVKAAAAVRAGQWSDEVLFNYRKAPPLINWMRGYGLTPFIMFPYKAIPATVNAALDHPGRLSLWPKVFDMLENAEKNRDELEAAEPDWMQSGSWLRLPDIFGRALGVEKGKQTHLNLMYIVPWGDLMEHSGLFMHRREPNAPFQWLMPNAPLVLWLAEMAFNKDLYMDRKIWEDYDTDEVKTRKMFDRMAVNILPAVVGQGNWKRLWQHLRPRVGQRLRKVMEDTVPSVWQKHEELGIEHKPLGWDMPQTMNLLFGSMGPFRARAFDMPEEKRKRYDDIKRQMSGNNRRMKDLTRQLERGEIDDRKYASEVLKVDDFMRRWLHDNPYNRWLEDNFYSPMDMDP